MKKEIKGLFYGVISCIIIDAVYIAIATHNEAPVSDYILMGFFLPIVDILSLFVIGLTIGGLENKLQGTLDDETV